MQRLIADAEGSEVWVVRRDTGRGHRVPIHPDQGNFVQGRGGGGHGDGGMEDAGRLSFAKSHGFHKTFFLSKAEKEFVYCFC